MPRMSSRRRRVLRLEILERDGPNCFWCERPTVLRLGFSFYRLSPPDDERTLDHFVTVTDGGSNEADNIVIACHRCNEDRGSLSAEAWLAVLDQRDLIALSDTPH